MGKACRCRIDLLSTLDWTQIFRAPNKVGPEPIVISGAMERLF